MKTLLLLRHAKSSWADDRLSDFDRPLNDRGREDAPRMGKLLRQHDLVPDLIIASPAKRAASIPVRKGGAKTSMRFAASVTNSRPAGSSVRAAG